MGKTFREVRQAPQMEAPVSIAKSLVHTVVSSCAEPPSCRPGEEADRIKFRASLTIAPDSSLRFAE